jgi:hypothetical protein
MTKGWGGGVECGCDVDGFFLMKNRHENRAETVHGVHQFTLSGLQRRERVKRSVHDGIRVKDDEEFLLIFWGF